MASPQKMPPKALMKSLNTQSFVSVQAGEFDEKDMGFRAESEKCLPKAKCSVRLSWPDRLRVQKALRDPSVFSPNLNHI
jgi:hypothetical protein